MPKKRNKELDFVFDNMALSAGVVGGTHIVGKMSSTLPSPQSGSIMKGMGTMKVVPTLHAAGGIFGQLQSLEKKVKKKR